MKIVLNLKKHCIETEIKRRYNHSLSQYFKADADKEVLEQEIGMLKTALENFDFPALRSGHKALAGNSGAMVELVGSDTGLPLIVVDGEKI